MGCRGVFTRQEIDYPIVFVPPAFAADGIMEAAEAGIEYCVSITDGIPAQDMLQVKRYMRRFKGAQDVPDRTELRGYDQPR